MNTNSIKRLISIICFFLLLANFNFILAQESKDELAQQAANPMKTNEWPIAQPKFFLY